MNAEAMTEAEQQLHSEAERVKAIMANVTAPSNVLATVAEPPSGLPALDPFLAALQQCSRALSAPFSKTIIVSTRAVGDLQRSQWAREHFEPSPELKILLTGHIGLLHAVPVWTDAYYNPVIQMVTNYLMVVRGLIDVSEPVSPSS